MLVECNPEALPPLTMTSALAGPYAVVQQSVGSKGVLLQSVSQEGAVSQRVPAGGFAAAAAPLAGGDERCPALPSPDAASGAAAMANPRIATRLRKQSGCISFLRSVRSATHCASPPRPSAAGQEHQPGTFKG